MNDTTDRTKRTTRMAPLDVLGVSTLALGMGIGVVGTAAVGAFMSGTQFVVSAAVLGVIVAGWGLWIAHSYDEDIKELQALANQGDAESDTPQPPLHRRILSAINPVNAYRVPMSSDEQMGLTAEADRQFRGLAEEELAQEIRMACAKATVRATEIQRMREGHAAEQMYANSTTAQSRADRHEADAKWLAFAYNRLAAGSTSAEQVRADWERRRAR